MQCEAAKVQSSITGSLGQKAALASLMEAQEQLLASPELLQNHPELQWDRVSAGNLPKLGAAKQLFSGDRRFADFR